jgi:hypothetical protein
MIEAQCNVLFVDPISPSLLFNAFKVMASSQ